MKARKALTDTQMQILVFIKKYQKSELMPPTRTEIMDHMGFKSLNAVQEHLDKMSEKGWLEIKPRISRGIRVL